MASNYNPIYDEEFDDEEFDERAIHNIKNDILLKSSTLLKDILYYIIHIQKTILEINIKLQKKENLTENESIVIKKNNNLLELLDITIENNRSETSIINLIDEINESIFTIDSKSIIIQINELKQQYKIYRTNIEKITSLINEILEILNKTDNLEVRYIIVNIYTKLITDINKNLILIKRRIVALTERESFDQIKRLSPKTHNELDYNTEHINFISDISIPLIPDIQYGANNYFNANIDNRAIEKIYFISDIHGDMYSFIINLRDNAKVIKKKRDYLFNHDVLDADLERQMNINLNKLCQYKTNISDNILEPRIHQYSYIDENDDKIILDYNDDMNYEWIGGNSHIIIVGDIIDNYRGPNVPNSKTLGEHIHEEIKLIRFINAIDDLAKIRGGRVIKLFGNHDFSSIHEPKLYKKYISEYARKKENHIHGINRTNYFNSVEGMNLLRYNGMGIILKINNYLCVHGAFTGFQNLMFNGRVNKLQTINDVILNLLYNRTKKSNKQIEKYRNFIMSDNGLLFNRNYGDSKIMTELYKKNMMNRFCNTQIIPGIQSVCDDSDEHCKTTIKIVIGHCVQGINITVPDKKREEAYELNQGFQHNSMDENNITQFLIPKLTPQRNKSNKVGDEDNYHYGMSISCTSEEPDNEVNPNPRLLRVDVGVSRGFDQEDWYMNPNRTEKELYDYFKSKSPQIIEVDTRREPNNIRLLRTTIKNMLIHQPRNILDPKNKKENIIKYANERNHLAGGVIKYKFNFGL
jgi:hypothetical protein